MSVLNRAVRPLLPWALLQGLQGGVLGRRGGGGSEAARVWGAAAQAVEAAETCASGVLWLELERVHLVGPRALRLKAEAMSLQ